MAGEGGFGGECARAALPAACGGAFGGVDCFEMLLQVGGGGEGGTAHGSTGHEPFAYSICGGAR